MDRRMFLMGGAGVAGAALIGTPGCAPVPVFTPTPNGTPFSLGVMSGMHSPTEVVLWTRLAPELSDQRQISWTVSTSPAMSDRVACGTAAVTADSDFTAKVLVGGLDPDRNYWFRFEVGSHASPIGRARTLPRVGSTPDRLRLAFASCQNWGSGWYNAWAGIAAEDLDAVVWLGDYIYESGGSGIPLLSVRTDPIGTSDDLASYRAKYRLYRSDPLLQAAHHAHPFVPIWDDHEFRDNYNRETLAAEPARGAAAYRAWFEYMPVWPIEANRIHRSLKWGSLAELFLLDTRQYRDRQANGFQKSDVSVAFGLGPTIEEANLPGRTIMGVAQRDWLFDGLESAQRNDTTWKLIANQVMISPVRPLDLDDPALRTFLPNLPRHNGLFFNMDAWDSYQWERDLLLAHLAAKRIENVSFLTGDIHSFWQSTLRADFDDPTTPFVANEFVSGSISSPGPSVISNDDLGHWIEQQAAGWSPSFRYTDFRRNGYGVLDATPAGMNVDYRVTRVNTPGLPTSTSVRFALRPGDPIPGFTSIAP